MLSPPPARKDGQDALSRLAALIHSSSDAIIAIDPDGIITDWNPAAEDLFHYSAHEICGSPLTLLTPEHLRHEESLALQELFCGRTSPFLETTRLRRDGSPVSVSIAFSPIRDSKAHFIGASLIIRRTRIRMEPLQAEKTVADERNFSASILESMPGILYFYDRQGQFLRWNRNFERVSGYSAAEIAHMHPLDFFPDEEKPLIEERIREVFERGESSVEATFTSKDGSATPYLFTGRIVTYEGRDCLVGMGIDISERKRAENLLIASEDRYHTLFEYAPDGILIANSQASFIDANSSICRMLGYPRSELIGLHASDIVTSSEFDHIDPALNQIQSGKNYHREWILRRKDGSIFPAEVIATLMPDGNILVMLRDVTERKAAEQTLNELNENLEKEVAARTSDLRNALIRAEAADRVKSAFLATMSHELRTPLNSIIGFTGILLQELPGSLNAEQKKQLGMVRNSARHLLALINDVLDLTKIEANQLEIRTEKFSLPEILEHIVAVIQPLANAKNLKLTLSIHPSLGEVTSDRRRIEQLLLNLLNNAIKFTEEGSISLTAAPLGNSIIQFKVTDTGIGIRPADLASLFQPFRQLDSSITRQHEGTGLGLAICKRLAHLLGGNISVSSEWKKGTTFTVVLPTELAPNHEPTSHSDH